MLRPVDLLIAVLALVPPLPIAPVAAQEGLPATFAGRWAGTGVQVNPAAEWPVTLMLVGGPEGSVVGASDYPSLGCGGDLTLERVDADANLVELSEALSSGEDVCADGGTVVLALAADGSLEYRWSHPVVDSPATGTLAKGGVTPVAIQIPAIGLDAGVDALDIEDGMPEEPTGPWVVGWYWETGWLGEPGNAVMVGARDWSQVGRAVFFSLDQLLAGDEIDVVGADCRTYRFRIVSTDAYDKATAPLGEIFLRDAPNPLLTIITDAEPFDEATGRYERSLIVRAELVESEPVPTAEEEATVTSSMGDCPASAAATASPAAP